MDTFFFIARKRQKLHKIYFRAVLINLENINYLDSIQSYYTKLTRSLTNNQTKDCPESIKKLYIYGINKEYIYFYNQIANVYFLNSTDFSDKEVKELFVSSPIFFKKCNFEEFDENSVYFERFRHISKPIVFLEKINHIITFCFEKLKLIESNYENIVKKDFDNMKKKNNLLNSLSVLDMKDITDYPKKRDTVDFVLFDLDLDLTNILISSLNIKYNKLATDDTIEVSKSINESYSQIQTIDNFLKDNLEKLIN
jgi:hypothetical protein